VGRIVEAIAPSRLGRDFRWLFAASSATNIGDGIAVAAGPLLIAAQTGDPRLVALALLLQRLPFLLIGLYVGVLADRLDRRRIAIVVNVLRALVVAALAVTIASGRANVVVVLTTLFTLGIAEVFADITKATLLPMVVAQRDLGVANARTVSGSITANQLVGPPIGAFLFAVGMAVPFGAQAMCMALGAVLMSRIARTPSVRPGEPSHLGRDLKEGFRWLWDHAPLRTLAITVFVFNITFGAAWSVLVLIAIERLQVGEVGYGLLITAGAIGGLLGAAAYRALESRFSLADIMRAGLVVGCLTHLTLATTTTPWVGMVILFLFGAHNSVWGTTTTTIRQRAVPADFQGRLSSLNQLGSYGGLVAGAALGGVIAGRWGVTGPFWFACIGSAITLVLIWGELSHIAHAGGELPSG
jgi:predicted MFS family arabinose efflux permease